MTAEPNLPPHQPLNQKVQAQLQAYLVKKLLYFARRLLATAAVPPGEGPGDCGPELYRALHAQAAELTALAFQTEDPAAAMDDLLAYLPKHFDYVGELLYGPKRKPVLGRFRHEACDSAPRPSDDMTGTTSHVSGREEQPPSLGD